MVGEDVVGDLLCIDNEFCFVDSIPLRILYIIAKLFIQASFISFPSEFFSDKEALSLKSTIYPLTTQRGEETRKRRSSSN
nr:MAG TPA: hypothetical protein [Caudoviricetes sp.]